MNDTIFYIVDSKGKQKKAGIYLDEKSAKELLDYKQKDLPFLYSDCKIKKVTLKEVMADIQDYYNDDPWKLVPYVITDRMREGEDIESIVIKDGFFIVKTYYGCPGGNGNADFMVPVNSEVKSF